MTAPIRHEHAVAAESAIPDDVVVDVVARRIVEERVAQLLADTEAPLAAEIAWLKAELDEEQSAHNAIGSVLAKAGCETPDGTSLGFARSAASNLAALSADYAAAVRALEPLSAYARSYADAEGRISTTHGIAMAKWADASERVLSTPRARAVLEQGETT